MAQLPGAEGKVLPLDLLLILHLLDGVPGKTLAYAFLFIEDANFGGESSVGRL